VLWRNGSTFAGDLGRYSLRDLADGAVINQQVHLRLPEHVNEARRNYQPFNVDGALGRGVLWSVAEQRDLVSGDAEIRVESRVAATIHDSSIANEVVEIAWNGGRAYGL